MKLMLGLIAAVLFMAIFAPAPVTAQGAFYAEETKEGRIYVFNDPRQYQLFIDSGELEARITRIHAGPNGETMYFDTINAIHMYNLKHDFPAEVIIVPEPVKPKMTFSFKDGKTTFESDLATLILSNRIQVRYTHTQVGLPTATDPDLTPGEDYFGSFRIRRAKTKMEGWFYRKWLQYELQLNWPASPSALEDANLNIDVTKGDQDFMIKGGQFKVPFGRQQLTSSGNQEFVDRSIVSDRYARGRDAGVQLWGLAFGEKLDWRVGVFNGNGINQSADTDANKQLNARLTFQPFGDVKYSEGDFETTDTDNFLFAVAAQWEDFNQQVAATTTTPLIRRELATYGFDAVIKWSGLFVFYDHFEREAQTVGGSSADERGWNAQVGFFIVRNKFEIAGRYAEIDPNLDVDNNNLTEYGIAAGYFYNKHNLKLQGDWRVLENDALADPLDSLNEIRVQLQFIF